MAKLVFDLRGIRDGTARIAKAVQTAQRALGSGSTALPAVGRSSELLEQVLGKALTGLRAAGREPELPAGAAFLHGSFTCGSGTRPYRLFVPAGVRPAPALLVMLHGCTQTAEDFAIGTRMNAVASDLGMLVLYPVQVSGANAQRCWNWFNAGDQARTGGEAELIASMTRSIAAERGVDPRRVFVAGLSAGGAQAAVLGATYPDVFAAVGVHSGLACGAAGDMASAFAAMRGGRSGTGRHRMRTIVFHGDRDTTVNASNGEAVADQVAETAVRAAEVEEGKAKGGLSYTRWIRRDAAGRPAIERWLVHGAGHAWFGGDAGGSYTEPRGPDASREMMRFFLG